MSVERDFKDFRGETSTELAAAILCLASQFEQMNHHIEDFDHQICMGIRWGLFGAGNDSATLHDIKFTPEEE